MQSFPSPQVSIENGPRQSPPGFEDIVQFSSAIYIVLEEEKRLRVDVMAPARDV